MKKLFCIGSKNNSGLNSLIKAACNKLELEYVEIIADEASYLDIRELASTNKGHLMYRTSGSSNAKSIENIFYLHDFVSTKLSTDALTNMRFVRGVVDTNMLHEYNGIPVAKSVYFTNSDPTVAKELVNYLGGFPVILKISGGSKGIGVIKIDSMQALLSLSDYFLATDTSFILREFVDIGSPAYSLRAVVLGDQVVFGYKNQSVSDSDFRSNTNQQLRERTAIDFSPEEQQIIVKAVHLLNRDFAGVDFVRTKEGELKIFEVNSPFNFSPVYNDLGFPIHEKLVEHLIAKSEKN